MGDRYVDLAEQMERQAEEDERARRLLQNFLMNRCDYCGADFDGNHQTYEFVDNFGNVRRMCKDAPHPNPVTEAELDYVRRSIFGKETA